MQEHITTTIPPEPQFQIRISEDLCTVQVRNADERQPAQCRVSLSLGAGRMVIIQPVSLPQINNLIDALTLARGHAVQGIGAAARNAARKAAGA